MALPNSISKHINNATHTSWHTILNDAMSMMDKEYVTSLSRDDNWLPGVNQFLNPFSINFDDVKYVMVGESPYPRKESSCGYCFYDAAVESLWSDKGLSKEVNRATSLRNFIKMLLIARGELKSGKTTQHDIAAINKNCLISTAEELFLHNMVKKNGFLLLNLSLALTDGMNKNKEARYWIPFIEVVFDRLQHRKDKPSIVALGKIAEQLDRLGCSKGFEKLLAEHPYNVSFIENKNVQSFFGPFDLLGA